MTTPVAALLPPDQAIPNKPEHDGASDTPDIAFSDLWQDKEEGLSFGDLLDIINPLQHIPVISTIYRMVTGDEIGVGARLAGGALFGGPLGLAAAGTIAAIEEISGNTVENHIATLWDSGTEDGVPAPRIASTMAPKPIQTAQSASPIDVDEDGMPFAADLVDPTPTVGIGQIASTQNNESESDQLAYTIEDGMPFAEEMIEKETAYTPTVAVATTQPVAPLQVSPQPIPRPPTAVAPMAAIHRVSTTAQAAGKANAASERQRIEQAISQAAQAQAALLLAGVGTDKASDKQIGGGEDALSAGRAVNASGQSSQIHQPFRSHPYMLPPGAPPHLISRMMEKTLSRYQAAQQQRNSAATPPAPRSVPAPVR